VKKGTDHVARRCYVAVKRTSEEDLMAGKRSGAKKMKDLDPKSRSKDVKGGNLPDDRENINNSVSSVTKTVQNVGPNLVKKGVQGPRP
jgi:hypothetical protein